MCRLAPQLEIVEGGTQFEQARTLASGECEGCFEVGSYGIGIGVSLGAKPQ
jgi:hypothetical protein